MTVFLVCRYYLRVSAFDLLLRLLWVVNRLHHYAVWLFNPPQQAIEAVRLSWVFCENCLSVFYEFFHSMIIVLSQWGLLFF